ncbi:MAG: hypothetical protein LBC41_01920 [Clostridiales bacterium]|jgi:hypothetical protein|nr:hypothetical protein [Clostridiales bacterium]
MKKGAIIIGILLLFPSVLCLMVSVTRQELDSTRIGMAATLTFPSLLAFAAAFDARNDDHREKSSVNYTIRAEDISRDEWISE